jgi:hypothetical protein
MPTSQLFTPIKLRDLELWNRIVVAPMCQYSADNGDMTDWHTQHLGSLSNSGAALVIAEATGVEMEGRISHGCPALSTDAHEASMKRVVDTCKRWGTAAVGIQLGHAGRKASVQRPWEGGASLKDGAWQTKSASDLPFDEGWHTPHGMTTDEIAKLKDAFVQATERADRAGYDLIEIRRPRLSAQPVSLTAFQQEERSVRRQPREPHAPAARDFHGYARGVSLRQAAGHPHIGRRVDRRRHHDRGLGRLREKARRSRM